MKRVVEISFRLHPFRDISMYPHPSGSPLKVESLSLVGRTLARQTPGVDLSNYLRMDPHLLVGLVNTELRNNSESLEDLVKTHNLDRETLIEKLAKADYIFREEPGQFR